MGDDGESRRLAALDDSAAEGAVVVRAERDPHGRGAGQQALVVAELRRVAPVRAGGIEDCAARVGCGGNRLQGELLVAPLVRRQAHAAQTDAELRGVKPARATQAVERTRWALSRPDA